jgi:flagellar biosynthesis/type III secretory pathway protein FliH
MQSNAATYSFPTLGQLSAHPGVARDRAANDAVVKEAIARGYAEGFQEGRAAADAAALEAARAARSEGLERGRAEGTDDVKRAADALAAALADLNSERAALAADAEAFCVDLALAIVARLVEADSVRAEFAARVARAALKVLAPEPASAIFLNPADHALAGETLKGLPIKDDQTLAPGHARVEAGRLIVEGGIDKAFEEIRTAAIEVKERRTRTARSGKERKR